MKEQKYLLRKKIKTELCKLTDEEKKYQSEVILKKLENLPEFQSAKIILMYWSLPNEVDTRSFIEKWSQQKTILLPVIQENEIVLRYFTDHSCLITGKFNICEPATAEFCNFASIDLCIIPGIAFDSRGNRLGKGKGFYDQFLPKITSKKIGICFGIQFIEDIPHDDWDVKMDLVLSAGLGSNTDNTENTE